MKKVTKILKIIILVFCILNLLIIENNAELSLDKTIESAEDFLNEANKGGKSNAIGINQDSVKETSNYLYNTLLFIGIGASLIMGVILGIKFIEGSIQQKADVKKAIVPYIIGNVILFGAYGIWKLTLTIIQPIA